jgi:hypothetical protein
MEAKGQEAIRQWRSRVAKPEPIAAELFLSLKHTGTGRHEHREQLPFPLGRRAARFRTFISMGAQPMRK